MPCASDGENAKVAHLVPRRNVKRRPTDDYPNKIKATWGLCGEWVDYADSARPICPHCDAIKDKPDRWKTSARGNTKRRFTR